jgi:hypothetical protein
MMSPFSLRKTLKAVQVAVFAISMFTLVVSGLFYTSELLELHKSPRLPMTEIGKVVPMRWSGTAVYITVEEAGTVGRMYWISMAALGFFTVNLALFGWQHGLPGRGDKTFWKDFWNE